MEKRISVVMSLVFSSSLFVFCRHLAHDWRTLDSQVRMDEIYLAGLFAGLMLQLWREKSKTAWMLMVTATIAFGTMTHLIDLLWKH